MIKIDEFDVKVLSFMYDRRDKPSTDRLISRKVIDKEKPSKEELDRMDKLIKYRCRKYVKYGLLKEGVDESDGRKIYRLSTTVWKKRIKVTNKKSKGYLEYLMIQYNNNIQCILISKPVNAGKVNWKKVINTN